MIPILYPPEEVSFETMGIGPLTDAVSCVVTEKLNSSFELVLKYPIDGVFFPDITYRSLILAKPNGEDRAQPFRVYKISKPMSGVITVNAEHISYDLAGVPVSPFSASGVSEALEVIEENAATEHLFTFYTDKLNAGEIKFPKPRSARSCLLGEEGSILDKYGGEYLFDRFNVKLLHARGADRGFSVRYGVNLTDIKQEQNCQNTYTGIYPYYYSEEDGFFVDLPEKVVYAEGDFGYTKIKNVDLTAEFEGPPQDEELRDAAKKYISEKQIGKPKVNITLKFEQLRQYEEYKHMAFLEDVALGDTVSVFFEKLGVDANAKCVKTVYDVLLERYDSLELGDLKQTVADTVITLENQYSETIGAMRNIAKVTAITTANSAKLELLVESDENGKDVVRGSAIIEAINGESTATIKADKINFEGFVSIKSGEGDDEYKTYINGDYIKTGVIVASNDAMRIDLDNATIEAANFTINGDGNASMRNAYVEGEIKSSKGSFGDNKEVEITSTGLKCGGTSLTNGGLLTSDGEYKTLISGGTIKFGDIVTLYAPRDTTVSGGFLGVFLSNSWRTLYFDESTKTVKFQ